MGDFLGTNFSPARQRRLDALEEKRAIRNEKATEKRHAAYLERMYNEGKLIRPKAKSEAIRKKTK